MLFNRGGRFSRVLEKVPEVVGRHPTFEGRLAHPHGEGAFRFRMRRADDPERRLTLTVLAFDVPGEPASDRG